MPSQVVDFIDQVFPAAKIQSGKQDQSTNYNLVRQESGELTGVLDLIDRIPDELLTLVGKDYSLYIASVGAIRDRLEMWRHTEYVANRPHDLMSIDGPIPVLNPMTHIRSALSKCHDSAPALATAGLALSRTLTLGKA